MSPLAHDQLPEEDRPLNLSQCPSVPSPGDTVGYWFAPEGTEVLAVSRYDGRYKETFTHWITLKTNTPRGKTVVPYNDPTIQQAKIPLA